jgi:hypothetical protein
MLEAASRHVYLEALRPPEGYALDQAVGTTYSLDLETLLAVPLGFAMLDWENEQGSLARDPVALLHALRRCADRTTVFCQAGRIAAPARRHVLFSYLEPMVVQAHAPNGKGAFHAKIWLLRFADPDGAVAYRFICLSRNLTADRSWDTILTLDGALADRTRAFAANHPLGEFIERLAGCVDAPLSRPRAKALQAMAEEVRRVAFEIPEPFDEMTFWPLGLGHKGDPLEDGGRPMLVMSPFASDDFLKNAAVKGASTLISRAEELDKLSPAALGGFESVMTLDDAAIEEDTDTGDSDDNAEAATITTIHRGLHAKLYIADDGRRASVWTGSANASYAAFGGNVEFLVQLSGPKNKVGIDAFLNGAGGMGSLLRPYRPGEQAGADADGIANEKAVEAVRSELAAGRLALLAEPSTDGTHALVLKASQRLTPAAGEVAMRCWPVTVNANFAHDAGPLARGEDVRFEALPISALTSFIVFEISAGTGEARRRARFTLNLPLDGAPADRLDHVLNAAIGDRAQLLRYLLFLLARDDDLAAVGPALLALRGAGTGDGHGAPGLDAIPLFEDLLRTLSRAPGKLAAVDRLVQDLKKTPEGSALLPEGFDAMWQAIWAARPATEARS